MASVIGGGTPDAADEANFAPSGIPWLTPADLSGTRPTYVLRGRRDLSQKGYESSGARLLPKGAVLFSTRAPIGYCTIAAGELSTNQGFRSLVLRSAMSPEYLRYYLLASKDYAESEASGTTFKELSGGKLACMVMPVAPEREQRRIVAKLDELLARSRRAKEALDAIPERLETLRRSILAAAFRGDLTADWRAEHPDVEPAETLLARIRAERRAAWERAEATKNTKGTKSTKGRGPGDEAWKSRYREPEPVDASELPELPEGWCWASLDELTVVTGGIAKGTKRTNAAALRSVPYLRVANVQRGHLDLTEVKTIEATEEEIAELRLRAGDILLNEGGDRDKLGRGWVWAGEIEECIHQNHVFRARPASAAIDPQYVSGYVNAHGQAFFLDAGKQTTNLASVSMSRVRQFPVALPPAAEQAAIAELVAALVGRVDGQRQRVAEMLAALREGESSLLAKAFRGELVPQDPSDEPADVMLARLRAEAPVDRKKPAPKRREPRPAP